MDVNWEPKSYNRRRQVRRGSLRLEGYGISPAKPMTTKEVAAVMLTTTAIYGFAFPSPEGISLGVLMGWLLTSKIPVPPIRSV